MRQALLLCSRINPGRRRAWRTRGYGEGLSEEEASYGTLFVSEKCARLLLTREKCCRGVSIAGDVISVGDCALVQPARIGDDPFVCRVVLSFRRVLRGDALTTTTEKTKRKSTPVTMIFIVLHNDADIQSTQTSQTQRSCSYKSKAPSTLAFENMGPIRLIRLTFD